MQAQEQVITLLREARYEEAREYIKTYYRNEDGTQIYTPAQVEGIIQQAKGYDGRLLIQQRRKSGNGN